ncbi:MAG: hypothetical protein M4579_001445 [Chaenotheca gracillima]|nr:MAG: hypothetical protein M4579_001445 [Chaenotheca gracillima]
MFLQENKRPGTSNRPESLGLKDTGPAGTESKNQKSIRAHLQADAQVSLNKHHATWTRRDILSGTASTRLKSVDSSRQGAATGTEPRPIHSSPFVLDTQNSADPFWWRDPSSTNPRHFPQFSFERSQLVAPAINSSIGIQPRDDCEETPAFHSLLATRDQKSTNADSPSHETIEAKDNWKHSLGSSCQSPAHKNLEPERAVSTRITPDGIQSFDEVYTLYPQLSVAGQERGADHPHTEVDMARTAGTPKYRNKTVSPSPLWYDYSEPFGTGSTSQVFPPVLFPVTDHRLEVPDHNISGEKQDGAKIETRALKAGQRLANSAQKDELSTTPGSKAGVRSEDNPATQHGSTQPGKALASSDNTQKALTWANEERRWSEILSQAKSLGDSFVPASKLPLLANSTQLVKNEGGAISCPVGEHARDTQLSQHTHLAEGHPPSQENLPTSMASRTKLVSKSDLCLQRNNANHNKISSQSVLTPSVLPLHSATTLPSIPLRSTSTQNPQNRQNISSTTEKKTTATSSHVSRSSIDQRLPGLDSDKPTSSVEPPQSQISPKARASRQLSRVRHHIRAVRANFKNPSLWSDFARSSFRSLHNPSRKK